MCDGKTRTFEFLFRGSTYIQKKVLCLHLCSKLNFLSELGKLNGKDRWLVFILLNNRETNFSSYASKVVRYFVVLF